jgi:carbamoyl-phosphate synthase small subunit
VLALEDGTVYEGRAFGHAGETTGEVVFNTALSGYQEVLTDPSYAGQIVTMTYPHIGNYGVNVDDVESSDTQVAGFVVREASTASSWRSSGELADYLDERGVVGITEVDTRALTRHLRDFGAKRGVISARVDDHAALVAKARASRDMVGLDLAREVTCAAPYHVESAGAARFKVVAYDFGMKTNIGRMLAAAGCDVTVVPATTSAEDTLALKPDGVFLSNGPGDPEPCDYAIRAIAQIVDAGLPTFGICLGHQLLGLASGARTVKMKFGHHGANHPVQDRDTGQVLITSQNHGFAVDAATLRPNTRITHVSLFDGSLQGIARTDRPAFGFQGHPEASPGPHDLGYLFDRFLRMMERK